MTTKILLLQVMWQVLKETTTVRLIRDRWVMVKQS